MLCYVILCGMFIVTLWYWWVIFNCVPLRKLNVCYLEIRFPFNSTSIKLKRYLSCYSCHLSQFDPYSVRFLDRKLCEELLVKIIEILKIPLETWAFQDTASSSFSNSPEYVKISSSSNEFCRLVKVQLKATVTTNFTVFSFDSRHSTCKYQIFKHLFRLNLSSYTPTKFLYLWSIPRVTSWNC